MRNQMIKIAITRVYRKLEVFTEKDDICNFALFHYTSIGLVITL